MSTPSTFAGFTQSHRRIFAVLRDGKPHPVPEILKAIDETAEIGLLWTHICNMRPTLRKAGYDVLNVKENGCTWYQIVRLIAD